MFYLYLILGFLAWGACASIAAAVAMGAERAHRNGRR